MLMTYLERGGIRDWQQGGGVGHFLMVVEHAKRTNCHIKYLDPLQIWVLLGKSYTMRGSKPNHCHWSRYVLLDIISVLSWQGT